MAETGAATVHVCVDTRGRLTADPTLTRSSGSRRIDDGALNLAKAGSGHYRPSTEDGQPVSACYPYRIRFELN
jgi:TonB family protein